MNLCDKYFNSLVCHLRKHYLHKHTYCFIISLILILKIFKIFNLTGVLMTIYNFCTLQRSYIYCVTLTFLFLVLSVDLKNFKFSLNLLSYSYLSLIILIIEIDMFKKILPLSMTLHDVYEKLEIVETSEFMSQL